MNKKTFKIKSWGELLVLDDAEEIIIYKKRQYLITYTFFNIEMIRPIAQLLIEDRQDVTLDTILEKLVNLKMLEEVTYNKKLKRKLK